MRLLYLAWQRLPYWTLVAMGSAAAGLILQIIALYLNRWIAIMPDPFRPFNETGLWNWCSNGDKNCIIPLWLYVCRTCGILGVMTLAASLTVALIPWKKLILIFYISSGLTFTAGVLIMLQLSIYDDFLNFLDVTFVAFEYWYRSSFALTVLALFFSVAATIFFLLAIFKKD